MFYELPQATQLRYEVIYSGVVLLCKFAFSMMVDLGVRLLGIIGASVSKPSMHLCGKWEVVCIYVYSCMHGTQGQIVGGVADWRGLGGPCHPPSQ